MYVAGIVVPPDLVPLRAFRGEVLVVEWLQMGTDAGFEIAAGQRLLDEGRGQGQQFLLRDPRAEIELFKQRARILFAVAQKEAAHDGVQDVLGDGGGAQVLPCFLQHIAAGGDGVLVDRTGEMRQGFSAEGSPQLVADFLHERRVERAVEKVLAVGDGLLDVLVDKGHKLLVDVLLHLRAQWR